MHRLPFALTAALASLLAAPLAAQGEVITVTSTSETSDFGGAKTVADLPGPDGKVGFHEAVTAANNTPGPQRIEFAIPLSEFWFGNQIAYLRITTLPVVTDDGLTIDGTTQTTFLGDTNPGGLEVGFWNVEPNAAGSPAILVQSDDNTFIGLGNVWSRGYLLQITGDRNTVRGCRSGGAYYAAVDVSGNDNLIGGTAHGDANVLSSGNDGVRISAPATGTVVVGNELLTGSEHGVHVRAGANGNRIGGTTPAERNVIGGAGHSGEEFVPVGAQLLVESAGNQILGNHVGVDASGNASLGGNTGPAGIALGGPANVVAGNLVGGLTGNYAVYYGIVLGDAAHGTVVQDNLVGTNAAGSAPIPCEVGIGVFSNVLGTLGTDNLVLGNTIAFNTQGGVVAIDGRGTTITRNAIFGNGVAGIDLGGNGVSLNDLGDGDGGPNGTQNFPLVYSATTDGASVTVSGELASTPGRSFTLEFFASPACGPSLHGDGRTFLGEVVLTTDAFGEAPFATVLAASVAPGEVVSATATDDLTGDTSEFGNCLTVTGASTWTELGGGLAGATGTPTLLGDGTLAAGTPAALSLAGALPSAPAWLVMGLTQLGAPFKGGTLVPAPDVVFDGLSTDATGALLLSTTWPAGIPAGTSFYFQGWIDDAAGPKGLAATNGLRGTTP